MARADISVFLTQKAYGTDPDIDLILKNYLEDETFANSSTYNTPNVSINNTTIDAPTEKAVRKFEKIDSVDGSTITVCGKDARTLAGWWNFYNDCHSLNTSADSNILITNDTSLGGRAVGDYCTSAGRQIQQLSTSSTSDGGIGTEWDALATAIHEIGHNLGCSHGDGYAYKFDLYEQYFVSPLLDGYVENNDNSNNGCNDIADIDTTDDKYNLTRYQDCELENISLE